MAEDIRERGSNSSSGRSRQTRSSSSRSMKSDRGANLNDLLTGIGISAEKASMARSYVATAVETKVKKLDTEEAMDSVVETASRVLSSMKQNAQKNPAMFFSGLTAAAVGIGLMLGAGREPDVVKANRTSKKTNDYEVE